MNTILILNAQVVNEGNIQSADVFVKDGFIEKIDNNLSGLTADTVIDAKGKYLFPGVIDDQVHFREPGLTHKACIHSEARAGVAGGVTSFMEMPNTVPNALNQDLLADKYDIAARTSLANYSFYMGASNDNIEEVLKTNTQNVCGIKVFMGSSTGNMLVDNEKTLENIFSNSPMLIATHCEDEATVRANTEIYKQRFGDNPHPRVHPEIRNVEACYKSSSMAVELAKRHNARLHILHITTGEETALFTNDIPLKEKKITAEVCVHHLWFDARDYETLGNQIKCNPAVKADGHKQQLLKALLDDRIDVIATDHAPHTWAEKQNPYWSSPSGLPLVQHPLNLMLEFYKEGKISLEKIAEKMSHAVADCFQIAKRGYIREGYWADLVLVDLNESTTVTKENIYYQCGWSPLEGQTLHSKITHTIVSGHLAFQDGTFDESVTGKRMLFER
ncbi:MULTISPECIES: dihydroorotase [unclassified Arcicella]|uniref:dihydroorotase n=1 Tax=unclassified Arcicella TaxID=2644986 RepID=UPI0028679DAA|nr:MULTISPECIES: dihydroorotase [unclassified Arcicella]MDR6563601.1 dihydroorotase [Arcicella sp. BE51]MDR6814261.1 dihydroorotase [Arcicella sp. BE140]MDR6825500.1 dihydroorotase [Arcicella sp. BE139]